MMRIARWMSVGVVVGGVVLAGGGVLSAKTGASQRLAGSQMFTVSVDGANSAANESFFAYFPDVTRVHPGDTVVFHEVGNGEPHTATLGRVVDRAVSAFSKLTPAQQNNPPAAAVRADAAVPQLFPHGPGDAVQSASNPCYLDRHHVPSAKCAQTAPTAFDGTQSYYNSGWLDSNARFTVHISSSAKPGTYSVMCLLHREGMTAKIVVVAPGTPVPSPAAQAATGRRQLAAQIARLAPQVPIMRKGLKALAAFHHIKLPAAVTAGTAPVLAGADGIDEYGPKTITIPVGASVTWYLLGPHSITFNSTKRNNDIRAVAADGSVHINQAAVAPAGGPGEPAKPPAGGSQKHPKFAVVASTSWNGRGFHNSGVFGNSFGPPLIEGYRVRFTRPGSYSYICTVHDHMKGTIVVG